MINALATPAGVGAKSRELRAEAVDSGDDDAVSIMRFELAASGPPQLQVAVGGVWERATSAALPASDEQLNGLLEAVAPGDAAVEVLWPGPPIVFVGTHFSRLVAPRLRRVAARADWTPSDALDVLVGGRLGPAVRAELGAVNAWQTVGPLRLALDAEAHELERALTRRPELASCSHPVALEVRHEHPCEAWWAIEISSRRGGTHELRADAVAALLGTITGIAP